MANIARPSPTGFIVETGKVARVTPTGFVVETVSSAATFNAAWNIASNVVVQSGALQA
ncbi:MAG: hypothetical protein ACRENK_15650 [Gemmatimonadaceae bacterium]